MSHSPALGESKEVTLPQGRIRYRERGTGEPVVFVHGLLVNGDLWRKVVPLLDGFRCIAPDLPLGSHEGPMSPEADLTPPGLARLIADFLEACDLEDVTLVANDTGGALSQILVTEHPERVGRLVLTSCDAYENFLPPLFKFLQVMARIPGSIAVIAQTLRPRPLLRLPITFGWVAKHPIDRDATSSYLEPVRRDAGVRRDVRKVLRGISNRYTLAAAEKLPRFDRPALVVWHAGGRVFPVDHGRRLAAALPQGRLEVIEDSYGFIPEDQPERLAQLIASFAGQPG
jgi:pimeloyl-ACP methyl ester carboxylesterase